LNHVYSIKSTVLKVFAFPEDVSVQNSADQSFVRLVLVAEDTLPFAVVVNSKSYNSGTNYL
jgi:hypothetical protein